MKNYLFFLISLFLIPSLSAQQDKRLVDIDAEMNKILEATKAAGFAVAVVEKDKVIYAKGFGYRDYENKIAVDENTLFAIGSSTKAFTSSILGQLQHDDKLSLDDSPLEYVPELRFYNDAMNNNIIIKDLMCHRTGLPRHDFSWYFFPTHDKDELIKRIVHQEPFTGVRQQWYYNNFMFLAQGVIAEKITGKSWEDNIRERFFAPLNMTRSNVSIGEMKKSSNASLGYGLEDETISKMDYYDIAAMSPAGSINSSVKEMSNWLITWINGGKFEGEQLIPVPYVKEAMSGQMIVSGGLPDDEYPDVHMATYGYGWFMTSYRGHYRVEHGGNINGFSANVAFYPSDSVGIVVLANQNGSAVPSLARNTIADRLLGTEQVDWAGKWVEDTEKAKKEKEEVEAESESGKIENTQPSHILVAYAGTYSHPGYGEFELEVVNDSLFAEFKLGKYYLRHFHYDVFEVFEVEDGKIDTENTGFPKFSFSTNAGGDISSTSVKMEPTLDPIEFKHTPRNIEVSAETLKSYVGEYDIKGTIIKIYTKKETTLYAFVEGQPEYELTATGEHTFALPIEGFKVEFIEGEDKKVNELKMIQPNGTFKASRI